MVLMRFVSSVEMPVKIGTICSLSALIQSRFRKVLLEESWVTLSQVPGLKLCI